MLFKYFTLLKRKENMRDAYYSNEQNKKASQCNVSFLC